MVILKYPAHKYSSEEIQNMLVDYQNDVKDTVLVIPDDLSVIDTEDQIKQIIKELQNHLHSQMYVRKCQFGNDELYKIKPCADKPQTNCENCPLYYSDDDAKWN